MIENRGTRKPADAWPRCQKAFTRTVWNSTTAALALLAGCSVNLASKPAEASRSAVEPIQLVSGTQEPHELRVAGLIPISKAWDNPSPPLLGRQAEPKTDSGSFSWTRRDEETQGCVPHLSGSERSLSPETEIAPKESLTESPTEPVESPAESPTEPAGLVAILLPPQPVESVKSAPAQPAEAKIARAPHTPTGAHTALEPVTPKNKSHPDQERLLIERVIRDCSEATTGVLTSARVEELATTKIRQANALANRGAQYAARQKLIEGLRMISQAKDAQQGDRRFTSALAAGLRALEEAEDFAPRGTQLEGELELGLITAAHRTPIARQSELNKMLPRQMMDCYFRYAQLKLAMSVADEPAGSMTLYALGKVTNQMGKLEPERRRLAHRRAVAFQQAALLSYDQNHLAAHELAVLLAESGHFAEAQNLLLQVATGKPNATVYENLAQVQQRMGLTEQAAISHALAAQLTRQSAGGANQGQWVAPEEFSRTGGKSVELTPLPGNGSPPMARRLRYDRRTALAPSTQGLSSPSPSTQVMPEPARPTPPPNWR